MKSKRKSSRKSIRKDLPFKTDQEYKAWLLANPGIAEAMVDLARETLDKQKGGMSPEKLKEMQALAKEFAGQIIGTVVPSQFNALAGRINKLIKQDRYSGKDIKELEKLEEKVGHLIEVGLDMVEPDRTKAMKVMLHAKQQIRLILDNLREL